MTTATLRKRTRAERFSDLRWALSIDLRQHVRGLRDATEDRIHAAYGCGRRPLGEDPTYCEAQDRALACEARVVAISLWDFRLPFWEPVIPYAYATAVPR